MINIDNIPYLGSGFGYRPQLHQDIIEHKDKIDFLEIIAERYAYGSSKSLDKLAELSDDFSIIPHGVGLSIGSYQQVSRNHLEKIKGLLKLTKSPYFSEHLAVTNTPGIDIGHLSPISFNQKVLDKVVENIKFTQDFLEVPLVLENITVGHEIPGSTMLQEEFFNAMCERSGCGMLLDLTNLYTNSVNWSFDMNQRLDEFPLEHVVQIHLAGGTWSGDTLIDSHSESVPAPVWELLELFLKKQSVKGVIIERDSNFPPFEEMLSEIDSINDVLNRFNNRSKVVDSMR